MKHKNQSHRQWFVGGCLLFCLSLMVITGVNLLGQTPDEKQAISTFENRVREYVKFRNQVKDKLPKLSKDSTPEQIHSYMIAFEETVRTARVGARRGEIFVPEIAEYIRTTLREDFKGRDRVELRKTILQAETQGVPLRVNYPYPESKEFTEMPPTLLLKLPQLPKEVKYRFVGRNMLLVDRENNLIIDFMTNALP